MSPQLRWLPSFSATCMHAASGIARGWAIADPRLQGLTEPARELGEQLDALGLPQERGWRLLCAWSASIDSNRQLARQVLTKALGLGPRMENGIEPLAGRIADLESAVQAAIPDLAEQLALRVRPLQEQWEARGPGLLYQVGKRTDPRLIVESADVLLVHPVFGGAGEAHLAPNAVRIEALLANSVPELPEVVRLAWLLAQLNCDLPAFSDAVHADRLALVARLALLPPILAAAEDVELVRSAPHLLDQAIAGWRIDPPASAPLATVLPAWWQTVLDSQPSWAVALTALDRMLGEDNSAGLQDFS